METLVNWHDCRRYFGKDSVTYPIVDVSLVNASAYQDSDDRLECLELCEIMLLSLSKHTVPMLGAPRSGKPIWCRALLVLWFKGGRLYCRLVVCLWIFPNSRTVKKETWIYSNHSYLIWMFRKCIKNFNITKRCNLQWLDAHNLTTTILHVPR